MSESLWPYGLQHARLPCPSPTPRVYSNSCPLSWWCHPINASSVKTHSPALSLSQHQGLFQWVTSSLLNGKSIAVYAPAIIFPVNIEGWFPSWLTGLICLPSSLHHNNLKTSIIWHSAFFMVQLSHPYMTTGKTIALIIRTFVGKVMSLLFNRLARLVITFLPKSKSLLISWLQSPSAVILEPKKIKSSTASMFSSSICHEVIGPDAIGLSYLDVEFQASFFTLLIHPHQEAL